jgi:hypothetical protein
VEDRTRKSGLAKRVGAPDRKGRGASHKKANMTQNPLSRVWDIIKQAAVGMLTTRFSGGLRARPLEARTDRKPALSGS